MMNKVHIFLEKDVNILYAVYLAIHEGKTHTVHKMCKTIIYFLETNKRQFFKSLVSLFMLIQIPHNKNLFQQFSKFVDCDTCKSEGKTCQKL